MLSVSQYKNYVFAVQCHHFTKTDETMWFGYVARKDNLPINVDRPGRFPHRRVDNILAEKVNWTSFVADDGTSHRMIDNARMELKIIKELNLITDKDQQFGQSQ